MAAFLEELRQFIAIFTQNLVDVDLSIKIVDNNSTDRSLDFLKKQNLPKCIEILTCSQQGYGAALKYGFLNSNSDYYAFADLDNTYPLADLIAMLKIMQHKNADMVLGARIHAQADMESLRRFGNWL